MSEIFEKSNINVLDLFETKQYLKICAPMVRYSKVQFRNLVKKYDCDLFYTSMIMADSFCQSFKARLNEFTTNLDDCPLITQFAANTVYDFVGAAHLVSPYCNGVDLNCGCPQRWANQQGLGCIMLDKPQLIYDIVRQCRNQITKSSFSVSVKLRISKDIRKTVEICRQLEKCGISYLTVHARTPEQASAGTINNNALKLINENIQVPLVANGGVKSLRECEQLHKNTLCHGVMVASGLLSNPSLFAGTEHTTEHCIQDWLNICYNSTLTKEMYQRQQKETVFKKTITEKPKNLTFQCFHHHLVFMLEKILTKSQRHIFNNLQTFNEVLDFIELIFGLRPQLFFEYEFLRKYLLDVDYKYRNELYFKLKSETCNFKKDSANSEFLCENTGNFFKQHIIDDSDLFDNFSNMFLEDG